MGNKISNFPTNQQPDVTSEQMTAMIQEQQTLADLPRVNLSDPQAIEERCRLYIDICKRHGSRPFVEGLCNALGTSRQCLWNWEQREDERGRIIRKYKGMLIGLLEQWSLSGKLNPATSCFLYKNLANYKDTVTNEIVQGAPFKPELTPAEVMQRMLEDMPLEDNDQGDQDDQ